MATESVNAPENHNNNETENRTDNQSVNNNNNMNTTTLPRSKSTNSISTYSPVTTPSHFHHPEYIGNVIENKKPRIVESARQVVVNIHPESGVDHSSLIENDVDNWRPQPTYNRRSWYSTRWEDKEEKEEFDRMEKLREEKRRRNVEEIRKLPCSLGKMVLKEQERLEANLERQVTDPRWTSRSPSANKPLCVQPRYESSVYSSPSRRLREENSTSVSNSSQSLTTASDANINENLEDSLNAIDNIDNSTFIRVNNERKITKGASMPEFPEEVKLFPYHILTTQNARLPKGVDRTRLEQHLTYKEFNQIFGMNRDNFWRLPKWKRMEMKKKVNLF